MTTKSIKILGAVVAGLLLAILILNQGRNSKSSITTLLPELKSQINDVTALVVRNGNGTVTIARSDEIWSVRERSDYAADVGILRSVLFALADAKVVEKKTSKPERYHLIGVNDPAEEDSKSIEVTIQGDGFEHVVILGKVAQSSYRYARITSEAQTVLIDKNPDVPDDAGGWLVQKLLDIGAQRVRQITITHSDGETIEIESNPEESGSFKVVNIPAGRELSYPGVANGIGNAFSDLTLEDVQKAPAEPVSPNVVTVFSMHDGLTIEAVITQENETTWISISATATPVEGDNLEEGVANEADRINQRVAGWRYVLPSYKANLLERRFDDLLKATEAE